MILFCQKIFFVLFTVLITSMFSHDACHAQPGGIGGIAFQSQFVGASSFEGQDSESDVESISAGTTMTLHGLSLSYEYTSFSWNMANRLTFGNGEDAPWEAMHSINLGYRHTEMVGPEWGYFIMIGGSSAFEEEADDSYGATGFIGWIYRIPQWRMAIRFGGGAIYNPVETKGVPFIGMDWNMRTQRGFTLSLGVPETEVAYRFNPTTKLSARVGFSGDMYRLADDSIVEPKGYLETEGIEGLLAFTFSPLAGCTVTLAGVTTMEREYTFFDKNGDNEISHELDDAMGAFVSIRFAL